MVDNSCITKVEAADSATIDMSIIGTGSCSDPYVSSGEILISGESGNVIQVLPDGLYVDECDISACIECVVVNGFALPRTVNGNCLNLIVTNYEGQGFAATDMGNYLQLGIPGLNALPETSWPFSCPITDGKPVYRDSTDTLANSNNFLYVEPDSRHRCFQTSSAGPVGSGTYSNGEQLQPTLLSYLNNDPCGRDECLTFHVEFEGMYVTLDPNESILILNEVFLPTTGYTEWGRDFFSNETNGRITLILAARHVTGNIIRPAGSTTNIAGRYTVQSVGGTPFDPISPQAGGGILPINITLEATTHG